MKCALFILLLFYFSIATYAQEKSTKTNNHFFQTGYISEFIRDRSSGLQGVELQMKSLLKKTGSFDSHGPSGIYLNPGISFLPAKDFQIYQANLGLVFYSELFEKALRLKFDVSPLNAQYYFGKVHDKNFSGKTVDMGMHIGIAYVLKNKFGIYAKYSLPGAWTMMLHQDYISPAFISAGIQF